jgi:selenocysteine-specific elongation factor
VVASRGGAATRWDFETSFLTATPLSGVGAPLSSAAVTATHALVGINGGSTALADVDIVAVSARTGEGIAELKSANVRLAAEDDGADRASRGVRLPIDRAFTIAGFGPVVTGSLVSGTISREQKLELLPRRAGVRVRRVEVHGRERTEARAGERVSVNLAGVDLSDLERGLVLATPGAFATSAVLTVRIELLPSATVLESGDGVSFHHFSTEARALVRVLVGKRIEPGGPGHAQLRLSVPIAAAPGDHFVIRRLSPLTTIGGGVVLDALAPRLSGRPPAEVAEMLRRLEMGTLRDRLELWIDLAKEAGVDDEALARRGGVSSAEVREALSEPLAAGKILALRRSPNRYVADVTLEKLAAKARAEIAAYVSSASGALGIPRRTLLARLLPEPDPPWAEAVEAALAERGAFVAVGEEARPPGRDDLVGNERELSERIAQVFTSISWRRAAGGSRRTFIFRSSMPTTGCSRRCAGRTRASTIAVSSRVFANGCRTHQSGPT